MTNGMFRGYMKNNHKGSKLLLHNKKLGNLRWLAPVTNIFYFKDGDGIFS